MRSNLLVVSRWIIIAFFSCVVFFLYANALGNDFVSDDRGLIINLPIWNLSFLLQTPHAIIRPLIYFFIYNIVGLQPLFLRLPNIILHIGVVYLFYRILQIQHSKIAFVCALMYAVHPLLVESISWISGGGYVQYGFFFLLSLYLYMISVNSQKHYYLSIVAYIAMLASSEKSISLAGVFIVYEYSFGSIKKYWTKTIPYLVFSGMWVFFYLRLFALRAGYFSGQQSIEPVYYNPLLQVPVAISSYIQLFFWPQDLTIYHSEMIFTPLDFALRVLVVIVFFSILAVSMKKNKSIFFWLSFFFITLLPTINPFVHAWVVAERYVYLGTVGIVVSVLLGLQTLREHTSFKRFYWSLIVCSIVLFSLRTIARNFDWKNEDTLWLATGKTSPSSAQNHNNLGDYYGRHKDYENSIREFQRAIELKPNYADAYHNLGNAYRDAGDLEQAVLSYQKALSIVPSIWQSYQNIAAIYFGQGKYTETVDILQKGLVANPDNSYLLLNLGVVYAKDGQVDRAKEAFLKVLSVDPNNSIAKQAISQIERGISK